MRWNLWIHTNVSTWASILKTFTKTKIFMQTSQSFDILCNAFICRIKSKKWKNWKGAYRLSPSVPTVKMDQIFWNLPAFLIFSNNNINNLKQNWTVCIKKLEKKWALQYLGNLRTIFKKYIYIWKWNIPIILPVNIDMSRRYNYSKWSEKLAFCWVLLRLGTANHLSPVL